MTESVVRVWISPADDMGDAVRLSTLRPTHTEMVLNALRRVKGRWFV